MATFGLTAAGFVPKLIADCEQDIEDALHATVDPNLDTGPDQFAGQMKSAVASEVAELWELAAACYSGLNPNNAEGFILDGDCAYTGTKRIGETFSTAVCQMGLNASSSIPVGSIANVSGQAGNTWTLLGPASPTTGLLLSSGPVVSVGAGTYLGLFQSSTPGPNVANAGQLSVITSAVTGWNTVTNPAAANLGSFVESDSELNIRREEELAAAGACTSDAMRADLLNVKGVLQAYVFENDGDTTDANGVPPHTTHAVIYDGTDPTLLAANADVAAVVWKDKPSGGGTYGSTVVQTPDSLGNQRTVSFDRAEIVPLYIAITATTDATFDVVNGPLAVKNAIAAYWTSIANLNVAVPIDDLKAVPTFAGVTKVQGVTKVTAFLLDTQYAPIGTADLPALLTGIYTLTVGVDGATHPYMTFNGA